MAKGLFAKKLSVTRFESGRRICHHLVPCVSVVAIFPFCFYMGHKKCGKMSATLCINISLMGRPIRLTHPTMEIWVGHMTLVTGLIKPKPKIIFNEIKVASI